MTNFSSANEQLKGYFCGEIGEISTEGVYLGLKKLLSSELLRTLSGENNAVCTSAENKRDVSLCELLR